MPIPIRLRCWPALALAGLLAAGPAAAQVPGNCTLSERQDPPRREYVCADGLTIVLSDGAALGFGGAGGTGDLTLDAGAALVDSPGRPVQIRTPQAIAAVRGTRFAVSLESGGTAVLVLEGEVGVVALARGDTAVLRAGEGVDVIAGQALEVKTWGAARVASLLALFGL